MQRTTVSSLSPSLLRIGCLTAVSALAMLSLGFAPLPALFYLLGACGLTIVVITATGPKLKEPLAVTPTLLVIVVPMLIAIIFRGTSLVWAVVPVLALVVASATWMVASTRYAATTVRQTPTASNPTLEPQTFATADELLPKHETAVTNDNSSETAA